jgi:1-deoxy-D-xylulose-5-phosphate synthase
VGEDGPTHAGAYDYAYMRTIPNIVFAPLRRKRMSANALHRLQCIKAARRYVIHAAQVRAWLSQEKMTALPIGKGEIKRHGQKIAILAFGSMVDTQFTSR